MRRPNRAAARVRSCDAPGARAKCRARLRDELLRSLALRERRHGDDAGASFFRTARRPWDGSTARGEAGHGRRVARAVDERVRVLSPPRPRRCRGSGGGKEAEVIRGDAQRQARARHMWRARSSNQTEGRARVNTGARCDEGVEFDEGCAGSGESRAQNIGRASGHGARGPSAPSWSSLAGRRPRA